MSPRPSTKKVAACYRVSFAAPGKKHVAATASKPSKPAAQGPRRSTAERLARRLALAHAIERWIDEGRVASYAEVAARLGVTRARVTQIAALALMPAEEQSAIVCLQPHLPRPLRD